MENLLKPVSTTYAIPGDNSDIFLVKQTEKILPQVSTTPPSKPGSVEEALKILRNEPEYDTVKSTLLFLVNRESGFDISQPSPLAAQVVHVIVSETALTYGTVLKESAKTQKAHGKKGKRKVSDLENLLFCLRSVTGLSAILLSLKQSIQKSKDTAKKAVGGFDAQERLSMLLELLAQVIDGPKVIATIATGILSSTESISRQRAIWSEFHGLIAGGKLLGIIAEAEDTINDLSKTVHARSRMSNGTLYSTWLAKNISHWVQRLSLDLDQSWKACAELLSRSLRLGHTALFIRELIMVLVLQSTENAANANSSRLQKLIDWLPSFDQKTFLLSSLTFITKEYLSSVITSVDDSRWWLSDASIVSGCAGLISMIVHTEESRINQVISWLTSSSGAGVGEGVSIRRAVLAVVAKSKSDIETVLEKSLQQFGDQLYIKHTPAMQQEVHAQVLLLAAGYVHRSKPMRLAKMMRSGAHLGLVSNRLSASSPRARFLGMIVGEALSGLVDKEDKKMDFKMDETKTSEAKWYKSLARVSDTVGSLDTLKSKAVFNTLKQAQPRKSKQPRNSEREALRGSSKIVAIEEVEDDSEELSDDDGLTAYAQPDSDAEDSDEDPTLITRNKPMAPVYIRDLITYLRDTENYDRQKLGLQTAGPLIRRKADFGTEVSSHAEELATLLVGIQDKYEMDKFLELRSQAMIAILIAQPLKMGQWLSKTFFDGDYSISQRASILITLGLGARELGGLSTDEMAKSPANSFPAKALPPSMQKTYGPRSIPSITAIDNLSTALSNTMIAPMAAELADKVTGPSILKVRTFSSRMSVEQKRKKPTTNAFAKVVADGFFFPLTGRFFIHLKAYGTTRSNITFEPYLLTLFLKTLSLLLHASGTFSISLPQMTAEFWDLLLSLRTQSIGDIGVVEALLFGFLTILETHADKKGLVDVHGRQMLETQEWVEGVFARVKGGSEEEDRVRMLAAGCLVRIRGVVEKYQALLMGDLASFPG
ncbi:telomere length regulation protein-domain-containing protein [Calycina marina]|uniref:Telomere length regulation protein-domain-containing protein n=1 Tax=Calycina marina TaxID=1763456 RepID=A0A9P7ZBF1_9HELO|nr:telomere length regulation protein-domain-containing protein [Calycina marina]